MFIDASEEPDVRLDNGERLQPLASVYTGMWSGTARYLIPADRTLASARISGGCGGMCQSGGGCEPPAGSYVKVLSIKPIATWHLEATTTTAVEELGGERTEIPFVASHPIRFEVTSTGRERSTFQENNRLVIEWSNYPEGKQRTTWSMHVTMDGLCPTAAACEPPTGAKLELGAPAHVKPRGTP